DEECEFHSHRLIGHAAVDTQRLSIGRCGQVAVLKSSGIRFALNQDVDPSVPVRSRGLIDPLLLLRRQWRSFWSRHDLTILNNSRLGATRAIAVESVPVASFRLHRMHLPPSPVDPSRPRRRYE